MFLFFMLQGMLRLNQLLLDVCDQVKTSFSFLSGSVFFFIDYDIYSMQKLFLELKFMTNEPKAKLNPL